MLAQGYCIRLSTDDDCEAICELMRRAFDYGDGSNESLNAGWWNWKYRANPRGRYSIVCEGPEGRLLGHYGGVPSRVWVEGRPVTFGQNCDSCSDPEVRRGLRNPGLFVRLAQAYASSFSGLEDNSTMYGLPIRSAHRIGSKYLDYWLARSQLGFVLSDTSRLPARDEQLEVQPIDALPDDLDAFLTANREHHRCRSERSAEFYQWRFVSNPLTRYQLAVLRDRTGALRGAAVYRSAHFMGRDLGLLVDLVAAPDDDAAAVELVRWSTDRAAAEGQQGVFFLAAPPWPWFAAMQQWGFRAETTDYVLAARTYASVEPAFLRDHWVYTLADFDIL
ncbi:MAG: hypothetical protein ACE37K_19090 [Planctomycetota bacterium]